MDAVLSDTIDGRKRTPESLAVDARRLGQLLGLSLRTIRRLDCSGKLPRPVKIGGAVRWSLAEIAAWLDAGSPDRERWEAIKQANGRAHGTRPLRVSR